jgi:elongation factor P
MVSAGDFRNGVTFDMDGDVFQIIEFQHVKPGKGAAFVRTKIRNVISGSVTDKTFNPSDKFPTAYISWTQKLMNKSQLMNLNLMITSNS